MKSHVLLDNAHAYERFSLGSCFRDRHFVSIILVYGKLKDDQIITVMVSLDAIPELSVDMDDDEDASRINIQEHDVHLVP